MNYRFFFLVTGLVISSGLHAAANGAIENARQVSQQIQNFQKEVNRATDIGELNDRVVAFVNSDNAKRAAQFDSKIVRSINDLFDRIGSRMGVRSRPSRQSQFPITE